MDTYILSHVVNYTKPADCCFIHQTEPDSALSRATNTVKLNLSFHLNTGHNHPNLTLTPLLFLSSEKKSLSEHSAVPQLPISISTPASITQKSEREAHTRTHTHGLLN